MYYECSLSAYHELVWGSGSRAPCIFNISPRLRIEVRFTPQPLYLRKKCTPPRFPLRKRLEWAPEPVQMFERREKSLALSKLSNPRCSPLQFEGGYTKMNNNGISEYLLLFSVRESPSFLVTRIRVICHRWNVLY
jgi:hypothetical protein